MVGRGRIQERATGRLVATVIDLATPEELRSIEHGWRFEWSKVPDTAEVFKLVTVDDPSRIQGLIALTKSEGFVEINLLESHPGNVGEGKVFDGVPGNLLAFAALMAFGLEGAGGYMALTAKSKLVAHYEARYGARASGRRLIFYPEASLNLIRTYFGGPHGIDPRS